MFDVKKYSSFLKVQSLKREPYLRNSFVGFLLLQLRSMAKIKLISMLKEMPWQSIDKELPNTFS